MALNLNLDAIRNLDSNKTYYLSNTTGEIKEAGFWQKIKCKFGFRSALSKVSNLVDAVRNSLLQESGAKTNDALDQDIRNITLTSSVKGSVLKEIVNRFSVADEKTIMKNKATKVASFSAQNATLDFVEANPDAGAPNAIHSIFSHAMKPAPQGNLPVIREEGKPTKLNTSKFTNQSLKPIKSDVANLLVEISQNERLGHPKIDKLYAKHIISTLFNEDGTRNDKGIDALKTPETVRMEYAFDIGAENIIDSRARIVHGELLKKNIDPTAKIASILSFCNGDKELEELALELAAKMCMNSNNVLRSDEKIKSTLAGVKANLDELRALGFGGKAGLPKIFKIAIANLQDSFPQGMLTRIFKEVKSTSLKPFQNLKSFSTGDEIYMALQETTKMVKRVCKNVDIDKSFMDAGEDYTEIGAPHSIATRLVSMGMLMAKLDAPTRQRMANAFTGTEASKMYGVLEKLSAEMDIKTHTVYTDPKQRKYLKNELDNASKVFEVTLESLGYYLDTTLQCEEDMNVDLNEGVAVDIRFDLDEIWEAASQKA